MSNREPAVLQPADTVPVPGPRQFDFWLGEWDVTWGDGQHARNRIEAVLDGHVILENFDGRAAIPLQGMSVSVFHPVREVWQQTWVDNTGNYWSFAGRLAEGRMILATTVERDGQPIGLRMVWFNLQPNALDWHWERSDDGGQTWSVLWALHYTRRAQA